MNWKKNCILISQYVSIKIGRRYHHENVWLLFAAISKYINGWSSNEPLLFLLDSFLILYYTFRSNLNEMDKHLFYLFELYISRHCTSSFLYKCLRHAFTTKYSNLNVKLREPNLS